MVRRLAKRRDAANQDQLRYFSANLRLRPLGGVRNNIKSYPIRKSQIED